MFTLTQLEFIKASLTVQNAAVPCGEGGKTARLFVAVLDEIEAQIAAIAWQAPPDDKKTD